MVAWTLDETTGAVYVTVSDNEIASQRELLPGALVVDLDRASAPVGFEAIGRQAIGQLGELATEYDLTGIANKLMHLVAQLGQPGDGESHEVVRARNLIEA